MLKYGKDTGLPETYRITLAISVAFLAHTLFMATFPFSLPEQTHNPVTVSVQLVPQGSAPSRANAPSQSSPPVRATPFTIEESPAPAQQRSIPTTSSPQPRSVTEPARDRAPTTKPVPQHTTALPDTEPPTVKAERTAQPKEQNVPSAGVAASVPSLAGERSTQQATTEQQELTLKSQAPSEESSYLSSLVQTIARKAKIPKLEDFDKGQVLSVELELNLMSNGALVGAKIAESSGHDGFDQRVYRAALAASPYPEPPSSLAQQRRFRVDVRYTF